MTSKTFVIGRSEIGLVWTIDESSLCLKKVWNKTKIMQHDVSKTGRGKTCFILHIHIHWWVPRPLTPTLFVLVVSLHGYAVSPGHVIRAGLQNGTMSVRARPGRNSRLYWILIEDELNTAGHLKSIMQFRDSDILNTWSRMIDGGVDAAERLHLPPLPTPSVTVTRPPPGTPFQTPTLVLPSHSDVTICTCTPRFIIRMAMLAPGNRPLTGLLPSQSPPWCLWWPFSAHSPSQQAVMSEAS